MIRGRTGLGRGSPDPAETADRQVSLPGLFLDCRLQYVRGRETRAQRYRESARITHGDSAPLRRQEHGMADVEN